jgi:hypothetical protein
MRDKFDERSPEFRQAYARLLMDVVRVTDKEIRISGPKSVPARFAAKAATEPAPKVLSLLFRSGAHEEIRACALILGGGWCRY